MPNTLAHLGVQTLVTKAVFSKTDFKWIAVGCIIPDIPWILQRLAHFALPSIDPITLRIYVIIQATLFFCLIICGSCSLLHKKRKSLFLILAFNCLLHLLLDSLQIKWANGVHLLAPFSWRLSTWDFFWPEHWISTLCTIIGLIVVPICITRDRNRPHNLVLSPIPTTFSGILLLCYFLLPFTFWEGPVKANNHYVHTLRNTEERVGKPIAIDRAGYDAENKVLQLFTGERIHLSGVEVETNGTLSLKGTFTDHHSISANSFHSHTSARDLYTIFGLFSAICAWLLALFPKKSRIPVN